MEFLVNGKNIKLKKHQVVLAKKYAAEYLEKLRNESSKANRPDYYITQVIILHVMTGEILDNFDPEGLATIMELLYEQNGDT